MNKPPSWSAYLRQVLLLAQNPGEITWDKTLFPCTWSSGRESEVIRMIWESNTSPEENKTVEQAQKWKKAFKLGSVERSLGEFEMWAKIWRTDRGSTVRDGLGRMDLERKYPRQREQHAQRPWGRLEQGLFKKLREDTRNKEARGQMN